MPSIKIRPGNCSTRRRGKGNSSCRCWDILWGWPLLKIENPKIHRGFLSSFFIIFPKKKMTITWRIPQKSHRVDHQFPFLKNSHFGTIPPFQTRPKDKKTPACFSLCCAGRSNRRSNCRNKPAEDVSLHRKPWVFCLPYIYSVESTLGDIINRHFCSLMLFIMACRPHLAPKS